MNIGVSGASGQLGATVLKELTKRGSTHTLVGISRTLDAIPSPVEGRFGDYDQPETLQAAYRGLDRLLIIPSADLAGGVRGRQYKAAIDAAVAAGVKHIVLVSATGTREAKEPSIWESYWTGEQHLIRNAPRWTILRMNYYSESFAQEAQMSLGMGVLTGLGENRVAFVSRDDVAAASAGILLGEDHSGSIYNATGPASITGAERAELVSRLTGKRIGFVTLTEDQLRGGLTQAGLPEAVVNAVVDIKAAFTTGRNDIVTGDIQLLAGRLPQTLEQVLTKAFANS